MSDILEIDGPNDVMLDSQRYVMLSADGATWQEAVHAGAALLEKVRFILRTEALNTPDTVAAILWRQRPYLISQTDLTTSVTIYSVKFALLTTPMIDLTELAVHD